MHQIACPTVPSEKRARQRAMREIRQADEQRRARRRKTIRRGSIGLAVLIAVGGITYAITATSGGAKKPAAARAVHATTTVPATSTSATPTTAPVSHTAVAPTCPPAGGAAKRVIAFTKAPPMCISPTAVFNATVKSTAGTFVIHLDAAASPLAVNNFVFLARYHFFNGIVFHRVIPGFVVQGGDPTGTGAGGPGYSFTGNLPPASCSAKGDCYPTWTVAMANSGTTSSDGSQFFIVLPGGGTQLSRNYTVIGTVTSGRTAVEKIAAGGSASGTPKILYRMTQVTVTQVAA